MHLIDALLDLCNQVDRPIIAVDGPAGAGKTTLAGSIGQGFSQKYSVRTIHMDDLYNGWDNALGDELTHTLEAITAAHLSGLPIPLKTYDWATCEFREPITLEAIVLDDQPDGWGSSGTFYIDDITTSP